MGTRMFQPLGSSWRTASEKPPPVESPSVTTLAFCFMASTKVSLATQLSSVEDADVASLATTQSLLQTQLQTSYKLISNMQNLSLVTYL